MARLIRTIGPRPLMIMAGMQRKRANRKTGPVTFGALLRIGERMGSQPRSTNTPRAMASPNIWWWCCL